MNINSLVPGGARFSIFQKRTKRTQGNAPPPWLLKVYVLDSRLLLSLLLEQFGSNTTLNCWKFDCHRTATPRAQEYSLTAKEEASRPSILQGFSCKPA